MAGWVSYDSEPEYLPDDGIRYATIADILAAIEAAAQAKPSAPQPPQAARKVLCAPGPSLYRSTPSLHRPPTLPVHCAAPPVHGAAPPMLRLVRDGSESHLNESRCDGRAALAHGVRLVEHSCLLLDGDTVDVTHYVQKLKFALRSLEAINR